MPGLSGIELAKQLRADRATQDVSVILMSRTTGHHETIAGLEAGADDFLVKPFSGRELLVRVQTRLELTAMRRRNAQQEEALASLQRTLKARDEFLSAASHELRTPITTLSLQTDGLLSLPGAGTNGDRRVATDDRMLRRLTAIRRQVIRLNQLVDQLLDVSRLIEGRLELRPEQVDLQALVIEAIDLMRESATQAGSPVLLRLRPEVVGHWDRVRIGQVITNLLSNAIKFGCGRPIEVELDADENSARVQVRDAGEGILPQEQERIFQRFERATSVQRHPGLGPRPVDLQADRRRQPRNDLRAERTGTRLHVQRGAPEGFLTASPAAPRRRRRRRAVRKPRGRPDRRRVRPGHRR